MKEDDGVVEYWSDGSATRMKDKDEVHGSARASVRRPLPLTPLASDGRGEPRREFLKRLLAGATGLALAELSSHAANPQIGGAGAFSFVLLGDLHFDRLAHHDVEWLGRDKPDDLRQVRDYSRITAGILPGLFASLRGTIAECHALPDTRVAFTVQAGDFVEGLCGSAELARRQDEEAIEFVRGAKLGVPFLFTKGNHDITGPGATEVFKSAFLPFLSEQSAGFAGGGKLTAANYALEHAGALFCFFDAYDRESLAWLEATLARRTARHCFVVVHPPVVPYGARSTWHLFSGEREKEKRERLLDLLGTHNVFVLSGHIHKYSLIVRSTPRGGRFLQLGLSSVISQPDVVPRNMLEGVTSYNPDQVTVEPNFSPATQAQRRAIYESESPFVKHFAYADLPGYALVLVKGASVTAKIHAGTGPKIWRSLELTQLLEGKI